MVILLAVMSAGPAPAGAADARERVAGSKVVLSPPAGFNPADNFMGFMQAETASSIMVTELAAPFALVREGMTADGLASRGMIWQSTEDHRFGEYEGVLIKVGQSAGGTAYLKYMGFFGDGQMTFMVVASFPEDFADDLDGPLRQAVLSADLDLSQDVGLFDGLTFHVDGTDALKIADRMSTMILLTRDGMTGAGPEDPLLIVGSAYAKVPVDDLETFARSRIMQTAHVEEIEVVKVASVRIDGLEGVELTATARDAQSEIRMELYQVIVVKDGLYYIVQGLVGQAAAAEYFPEFRKVAGTMTFVE